MPPKTKTSVGMETVAETVKRAQDLLKPTISANELTNPTPTVTPPVPNVNTNTGATTAGIVNNVATDLQQTLGSDLEARKKADEYAALLGADQTTGQEIRNQYYDQFGVTADMQRRKDILNQIAKSNEASNLQKVQIQSGGQGAIQGQRSITQEDREQAVRTAGLAAEASILQGNIETASTLINQAMSDYYSDRQMQNANMIQQLNYYSGIADEQTKQLLTQEQRRYEEDQTNIKRAQSMVDGAVTSGYVAGTELQDLLAIKDPAAQAEKAQMLIARGIQKDIAEAKAAATSGGFDMPETKNFGTTDNPIWKQWNATTGQWEDVTGIEGGAIDDTQKSLDQLSFLRDAAARILGGDVKDENGNVIETYDALYKASGPSDISKFFGDKFVGDTDYRRLETYADTLRTNVLALMTDPTIKKFFGPQMSNADVKLMSATGSTLRPESMSKEDMKSEVERLDDLLNRMQTSLKSGGTTTTQGNVITAPDGIRIEIID